MDWFRQAEGRREHDEQAPQARPGFCRQDRRGHPLFRGGRGKLTAGVFQKIK